MFPVVCSSSCPCHPQLLQDSANPWLLEQRQSHSYSLVPWHLARLELWTLWGVTLLVSDQMQWWFLLLQGFSSYSALCDVPTISIRAAYEWVCHPNLAGHERWNLASEAALATYHPVWKLFSANEISIPHRGKTRWIGDTRLMRQPRYMAQANTKSSVFL